MGSANFTSRGLNINDIGNVEEMIKVPVTNTDLKYIEKKYVNNLATLEITPELVKKVKEGKKIYNKKYNEIVSDILDWSSLIFPKEEKTMFSNYQSTKKYPLNFQFEIKRKSGEEILSVQQGISFKLGGLKEKPDAELFVDYEGIQKLLKSDTFNAKSDSWMFRLSFIENQPNFRITNSKNKKEEIISLNKSELLKSFRGSY